MFRGNEGTNVGPSDVPSRGQDFRCGRTVSTYYVRYDGARRRETNSLRVRKKKETRTLPTRNTGLDPDLTLAVHAVHSGCQVVVLLLRRGMHDYE